MVRLLLFAALLTGIALVPRDWLTRLGVSFPFSHIRSSAVIQHMKTFPNTKTRLSKEDEEKNIYKNINKMISKKTYPICLHRFQQHRKSSA